MPASQTRPEVVAGQVDQHHVLGALLGVGQQVLGVGDVLLGGGPAGPGAGDRVGDRPPAGHLDQGLRAGADDVVRRAVGGREAQEVHVRAGVRRAQHAVDVQRVGRAVDARTAGRARPGTPRRRGSPPCRPRPWRRNCSGVRLLAACGAGRLEDRDACSARTPPRSAVIASSRSTASCQACVDPLVGRVVVDRVGHQQQRPVAVVQDGQVGGQHHRQLGQVQLVRCAVGHLLPAAYGVVGDRADHAAGQRRQPGQVRRSRRAATVSRSASTGLPVVGTPTGGSPIQCTSPSRSVRVARLRGADDRVARPHAAVLGRLQQEGAGLVLGQLAVDPDRGLGVGQQPAHDRDHPAVARHLGERRQRRPGVAVAQVRRRCARRRLASLVADRRVRSPGRPASLRRSRARRSGQASRCPWRTRSSRPSKQDRDPVWQADPDLVDPDQQGVAVAVERDVLDQLDVARRCRPCASTPAGCGTRRSPGRW